MAPSVGRVPTNELRRKIAARMRELLDENKYISLDALVVRSIGDDLPDGMGYERMLVDLIDSPKITDTRSVKMESVKMINESSRHVLAECLRILPVRESDTFDMIYQGDVEDVLGLESDGDCLYTAESVYRLADLISSCGDRVGEADD